MSEEHIGLSRRRLLAGLGTVGVASAGAGLGTSALFSDEESFEDNTITAGTLDMEVTATVEAASEYWSEAVDLSATADGEAVSGISIDDVKPGDWGIICFDISIADNPGYVNVSTADLVSEENGYTEPEPEDDNGEGELEENIVAEIYGEFDESVSSEEPRDYLSDLDSTTPAGTTLEEAFSTYEGGVTLGGSEDPTEVGDGEDAVEFCLLLEIPETVGNEIQGDSLTFDLLFESEQVRNNDDPFDSGTPDSTPSGTPGT
ncbi:SipW-dependent-type signal peptide-containing protein [Halorientalis halophila]|uniref:SipW-dependent-type signal peptide-containing protein n=1 Tax=Halorientalis halophila TaxID=3108499 RepID=UPI00300999BF